MLVIAIHCLAGIVTPEFFPPILVVKKTLIPFLNGGVDLFFVLSGFLIGGILLDKRKTNNLFRAFWVRRAARILPVYVLLLLTYEIALIARPWLASPWLDGWLLHGPLPLWTYLTFTQNYAMELTSNTGSYWVAATWSLAVEEQFYLLLPLLIYLLDRRKTVYLAIACIVGAPIVRVLLGLGVGGFFQVVSLPARMDALMMGVLVACMVRSPVVLALVRRVRPTIDMIVLGLIALYIDNRLFDWQPTLLFSFLTLVFGYLILRIFIVDPGPYRAFFGSPLLVGVGGISYAWYMCHEAVNGIVHGILFGHAPVISNSVELATAAGVILLSAGLALSVGVLFERPFRAWGRRVDYEVPNTERNSSGDTEAIVNDMRPQS